MRGTRARECGRLIDDLSSSSKLCMNDVEHIVSINDCIMKYGSVPGLTLIGGTTIVSCRLSNLAVLEVVKLIPTLPVPLALHLRSGPPLLPLSLLSLLPLLLRNAAPGCRLPRARERPTSTKSQSTESGVGWPTRAPALPASCDRAPGPAYSRSSPARNPRSASRRRGWAVQAGKRERGTMMCSAIT